MGCGSAQKIPPWMEPPPPTPLAIEIKKFDFTPTNNYLNNVLKNGTIQRLEFEVLEQRRNTTESIIDIFDNQDNNSILWNVGKNQCNSPGKFSEFKGLKHFLSLQEGVLIEESRSQSTQNGSE